MAPKVQVIISRDRFAEFGKQFRRAGERGLAEAGLAGADVARRRMQRRRTGRTHGSIGWATNGRDWVALYAGFAALFNEFGAVRALRGTMTAQPFLRPGWGAMKNELLKAVRRNMQRKRMGGL